MRGSTNSQDGRQDRSDASVLESYIDAHERRDYELLAGLLSSDVRLSLPDGQTLSGRSDVGAFFSDALGAGAPGDYRLVPVPDEGPSAVANHVRRPGEFTYEPISVDVLAIADGQIREIIVRSVDGVAGSEPPTSS